MNQVRGTSIYLRRPGPLESKRNDWWRDNERFSVQVSTKTIFVKSIRYGPVWTIPKSAGKLPRRNLVRVRQSDSDCILKKSHSIEYLQEMASRVDIQR